MRPRTSRGRTLLKFASVSVLALIAADVAITQLVIPDGVYVWKPLPPFSACMTDEQRT